MSNINIFVGNLSLEMTADELRKEFVAFGQVISVIVTNDKYIGSGQLREYGFGEMDSKSEGAVAIASLKGKAIRGGVIKVVEALPLADNNDKWKRQTKKILNHNRNKSVGSPVLY